MNCGGASAPSRNKGFSFFFTLSIKSFAALESSNKSLRTIRKSSANGSSMDNKDALKYWALAMTLLSEDVYTLTSSRASRLSN